MLKSEIQALAIVQLHRRSFHESNPILSGSTSVQLASASRVQSCDYCSIAYRFQTNELYETVVCTGHVIHINVSGKSSPSWYIKLSEQICCSSDPSRVAMKLLPITTLAAAVTGSGGISGCPEMPKGLQGPCWWKPDPVRRAVSA